MKSLGKLELFKDIGKEAMHSLYFSSIGEKFAPGTRLLPVGKSSTSIFYIVSGKVNVDVWVDYTSCSLV